MPRATVVRAKPVLVLVVSYSAVLVVWHTDAQLVVPFAALFVAAAYPGVSILFT